VPFSHKRNRSEVTHRHQTEPSDPLFLQTKILPFRSNQTVELKMRNILPKARDGPIVKLGGVPKRTRPSLGRKIKAEKCDECVKQKKKVCAGSSPKLIEVRISIWMVLMPSMYHEPQGVPKAIPHGFPKSEAEGAETTTSREQRQSFSRDGTP
jgi:hypothetical protein